MSDAAEALGILIQQVIALGQAPVLSVVLFLGALVSLALGWFVAGVMRGRWVPESREKKLEADLAAARKATDEVRAAMAAEIRAVRDACAAEIKDLRIDLDRAQERELAALRAGNTAAAQSVLSGEQAIQIAAMLLRQAVPNSGAHGGAVPPGGALPAPPPTGPPPAPTNGGQAP